MNLEREKAARKLKLALDACHKAGLQGGVFSGTFFVWPNGKDPYDFGGHGDYEQAVIDCGGTIVFTDMALDGGAGN